MALPRKVFLSHHKPKVGASEDQLTFFTGVYQRNDGLFEAVTIGKVSVFKGLAFHVRDILPDAVLVTPYDASKVTAKFKLDGFDVQGVVLKFLFCYMEYTFELDPQPDCPVHLFDEARRPLNAQIFDARFRGSELTPPCTAVCDIYGLDEQPQSSLSCLL